MSAILSVDDGENAYYNSTMSLDYERHLNVDGNEGILLGGDPQYQSDSNMHRYRGINII